MGNQNTSGIIEEEKVITEAPEKAQVSSPHDQEEQIVKIGAEERIDFQEKAAEADSRDSEADRVKSDEKDVSEEHKGSVDEGSETQNTIANEIVKTLRVDTKDDDHDEGKNKDDLVDAADIASIKGESSETRTHHEFNSFNTVDDIPSVSLQDLSAAENEKQNECSPLSEEKLTMNELGNGDETSCVNQTRPSDQETDQVANIKSDDKKNEVEICSIPGSEKVDLLDEVKAEDENALESNPMAENDQEDDKSSAAGETILENEVTTAKEHKNETSNIEKCISHSQFSSEIERETEFEKPILDDIEKLDIGSISSCEGGQVELRKSPSFDFGLPFDARSEESDQTPLLYNRTTTRSFSSSSSALRFQNRSSVQTECFGESLRYEAVEVEEKTIRMERSNSESSSRANLSLTLPNEKEKADVVTEAKQETCVSDKRQENGIKGSPSREDCDVIFSPRGSGKRKPRSSFFTTCICCTAAIN